MIVFHTDGGCQKSGSAADKHIGAWAICWRTDSDPKERPGADSGCDPDTTNNRMELTAVLKALELAEQMNIGKTDATKFVIFSDSQYAVKGASDWMYGWAVHGWKKKYDKKPVENLDLWKAIWEAVRKTPFVTFLWVRGHAGVRENELVDMLCSVHMAKLKSNPSSLSSIMTLSEIEAVIETFFPVKVSA